MILVSILALTPNDDDAVIAVHLPSPVDPKILAPTTEIRFWVGVREAPYRQKSEMARTVELELTMYAGLVFPVLVE